jgi:hypothetical protein
MIFHPAIIALVVGSLLVSGMLLYASWYGVKILSRWEIHSGSERQLDLERRTYLISTMMNYAFGFQLLSLFLFIYTADHLSSLFVGAMCAAGTLNVNAFGYPTVMLKIINFLLAGLWLIVNYTDNQGYDYPLIKKKYALLIIIVPFIMVEMIIQAIYFLGLKPNIITSCCGTLFSSEMQGISSSIVTFPRSSVEVAFYSAMIITLALGIYFYRRLRFGYLFSVSSTITFVVSIIALISFLCLYFYELPTHHCPFCILQKEYNFVGYPLYLTLLGGAVPGMGVAAILPCNQIESLANVVPSIQRGLTLMTIAAYSLFMAIVTWAMIFSNLSMKSF